MARGRPRGRTVKAEQTRTQVLRGGEIGGISAAGVKAVRQPLPEGSRKGESVREGALMIQHGIG